MQWIAMLQHHFVWDHNTKQTTDVTENKEEKHRIRDVWKSGNSTDQPFNDPTVLISKSCLAGRGMNWFLNFLS
jgi:hypothetical protein